MRTVYWYIGYWYLKRFLSILCNVVTSHSVPHSLFILPFATYVTYVNFKYVLYFSNLNGCFWEWRL